MATAASRRSGIGNSAGTGKRRLVWSFGLATLLGVPIALAVIWINDLGRQPFSVVEVHGTLRQVSPKNLRAVLAPALSRGYFGIDVDQLRNRLQALAWVEQAHVRRIWPDRLNIDINEHVPRARWGKEQLLSYSGARFTPSPGSIPEGLPQLDGPPESELRVLQHYLAFSDLLKIAGLGVQRVSVDVRGAWYLVLDNGLKMLLGRERMQKRLWRLARVYPLVIKPRVDDIAQVDLRYGNGFAVRWHKPD